MWRRTGALAFSMTSPFDSLPKKRRDTSESLEISRICSLPVVLLPTVEEITAISREVVQADAFEKGFRLHAEQAGALLAWDLYEGLFGPIGVGKGKTFITLLIADRAHRQGTSKKSLLIVPPTILAQLELTDIPKARKLFGIRVPIISLSGRNQSSRGAVARSDKRGLYIMPYTFLSTKDAEEILAGIAPDLLILDEAHRVKNHKAARTRRLMRYVERAGNVRMVALSGTITSKSIRDYHHLCTHALREQSPLPISPLLTDNWAMAIDANADPSQAQTGPITPLMDWAVREFPEHEIPKGVPGFRAAFRLRLNTAPGVVASGDTDIGTSLVLHNEPVAHPAEAEGYAEVERLMKQVEELWISPSGDEIEHGMHKWRHLYELTAGFYYHLRWPSAEEVQARQRITLEEAVSYLVEAQKHHEAQQGYHKELRRWIERRARPSLDTPMLIGKDMSLHGSEHVGAELYEAWRAMKDLEFEGMPERLSEPRRISPWKIEHAAAQAIVEQETARAEGAPCGVLVWYWHQEVGAWLNEKLIELGAEPLWCPSDSHRPGSSAKILDPENGGRIIVAAMGGHGEGKNLQHFQRQVIVEFPRKADLLEQVIGRTHRTGQNADELLPVTINSNEFDHQNMSACLIDALYIHQSTGSRQKAVYAGYDPLPRVYPPDFLRERGFTDLPQLDSATRAALEERFGPLTRPK